MRDSKILFLSPANHTFCQKDVQILMKHYEVKVVNYSWNNIRGILMLPVNIFFGTLWCDITFSWFGGFHAFIAIFFSKILQKKSIIIAGGYDVVCMPEIGYGLLNKKFWKYFAIYSFKWCDKIIAVSEYTRNELIQNVGIISGEKINVIYHGFDTEKYYPSGKKKDVVVTVGSIKKETLTRKGIENFVRASKFSPEHRFILIGKYNEDCYNYLNSISDNIELAGYVDFDSLLDHLQQAKVYVQISAHEGFGCSIAEAMLCECIPVVTNRGAIPEVVGDTGYYVEFGDIEGTIETIKTTLRAKNDIGEKARRRIKEKFKFEEREIRLVKEIDELIKTKL